MSLIRSVDESVSTSTLRHNPLNGVTASVERLTTADGRTVIRKELSAPGDSQGPWAASADPRHWNYWRREVDVYQDGDLRQQLTDAGIALPEVEVEELDGGAVLYLEDIEGTPGTEFALVDHAALGRAVGRWQARPAAEVPWSSTGFLRDYSTTRDVPWELLDDDRAWRQPLIADNWPSGLRAAWTTLVAHRNELLSTVEQLPRARCHLDLWVSNVIRRPTGEFALLDWAFTGDGALGEDIGNHVPDAALDLFWPAERLAELAETCVESYLEGLREGDWQEGCGRGDADSVRLAVMASGVKYAWLVPLILLRAGDKTHNAYHQEADSQHLFQQRGIILTFLAEQCAQVINRRR
ncbi:aminoglycoside phosphotransferase family protein [Kribbella qitaiheensis]|uniref:Aminoglycoside phosphotransferase family protein n=1 Tax=Kribbella qitaiheensis TaxID=1544730 RepID=A0A7G6X442_9ACTN|nr:aminoglycoside phosphotransferase family protein [Kribbella qitaiheensis]QNE21007.1 aminoglycoside phosphotransferase family protein [Kribbella qitaiheensis]